VLSGEKRGTKLLPQKKEKKGKERGSRDRPSSPREEAFSHPNDYSEREKGGRRGTTCCNFGKGF